MPSGYAGIRLFVGFFGLFGPLLDFATERPDLVRHGFGEQRRIIVAKSLRDRMGDDVGKRDDVIGQIVVIGRIVVVRYDLSQSNPT